MAKALITGINGFVGSHLAPYLLKSGIEVHGTTKPGTETPSTENMTFHAADIMDFKRMQEIIEEISPDYVFHLAALTSPGESFKNPAETVSNNIVGQINILEAVRDAKLAETKILVVSSAEVYGKVDEKDLPIDEETPYNPMSPYSVSKVAQDLLGLQYFNSYKMHTIRVRPFNHIGPRQAPFFVVPAFAKQIAEIEKGIKEPVLMVGNLEAKRDFTDVRDVVKAYLLLMDKGQYGDVYNIGSGKSHRIGDILDTLLSFSKVKITVKQDPALMRPSDVPDHVCNPSKIENLTGWKREIDLNTSLKDVLDYWREIV